jgi:hypothetical protein
MLMKPLSFMEGLVSKSMSFDMASEGGYAAIVNEGLGVWTDGDRVFIHDVHMLCDALRGYCGSEDEWVQIQAQASLYLMRVNRLKAT